ncbi:MAG: hypothetical protein A2289_07725 [Deltaproteobacteria bacterium RIFOXYA12_FULL_58_15]|nr:MAG: hypothetical protein A2289_07725 [Deltaproteobacteria bacterium RIFOXYA12_FULL_58_15]
MMKLSATTMAMGLLLGCSNSGTIVDVQQLGDVVSGGDPPNCIHAADLDCPTTCNDGVCNGDETGVDCGGSCTNQDCCTNGFLDIDLGETGVDCAGSCVACVVSECSLSNPCASPFQCCAGRCVSGSCYFVSNSGDDTHDGLSESAPWASLEQVNSLAPHAGDHVLFHSGDHWEGTLTVNGSGTVDQPIVYRAYGTGAKPKLFGSKEITGWATHAGNIYKARIETPINQLFVDGMRAKAARSPNSGYHAITSVQSPTEFTSTELDGSVDYAGALWTGRTIAFAYVTSEVIDGNGQSLTLSSPPFSDVGVNEGFFLTNKLAFLDAPGEWFYDDVAQVVYFWPPDNGSPAAHIVRGSVFDDGIVVADRQYVVIEDFSIQHNGNSGMRLIGSHNTLHNNEIDWPDAIGIREPVGSHNTVSQNVVRGANHFGISAFSTLSLYTDNVIYDTFLFDNLGLSAGGSAWYSGSGMYVEGDDNLITYNRIINAGYNGIQFHRRNRVEYNYINNACLVKDDGGGIYTASAGSYPNAKNAGSIIKGNIIDTVPGSTDGWSGWYYAHGNGVYLDENSGDITVEDNTITNCSQACIFYHLSFNDISRNNTLMNARSVFQISTDLGGSEFSNNILYAFDRDMEDKGIERMVSQRSGTVTIDNNQYVNHYNSDNVFSHEDVACEFAEWKLTTGQDANSTFDVSPLQSIETEVLLYNDTKLTKAFDLVGSHRDLDGNPVASPLILESFASQILIKE